MVDTIELGSVPTAPELLLTHVALELEHVHRAHTRSLLLPLKAVLLKVISVGAAWGVITLVWQQGHGSDALWGISATHQHRPHAPIRAHRHMKTRNRAAKFRSTRVCERRAAMGVPYLALASYSGVV